jgi:hypothetical protein
VFLNTLCSRLAMSSWLRSQAAEKGFSKINPPSP